MAATQSPEPPPPAALHGELLRFVWQAPSGEAAIAILHDPDQGRWTIKGPLWGLRIGDAVRVWGKVVDDPRYGRQFRVESAQPALPASNEGLVSWLAAGAVAGIGKRSAQKLVERLGDDALGQIRADPAVLKGALAKKKAKALLAALDDLSAGEQTALFLHGLGLGPALVAKIQKRYGPDAGRQVQADPFQLAQDVDGIGFRTADKIARAAGVDPRAPARLLAAVAYALGELAALGHTAPTLPMAADKTAQAAELTATEAEAAVAAAVAAGRAVATESADLRGQRHPAVALPELHAAELAVAEFVLRAAAAPDQEVSGEAESLARAEGQLGFALEGSQLLAVRMALGRRLLVVTGGPGTGKTTIVRGVLAAAPPTWSVVLAAPTGRACRRLAEAAGREAQTLHRLLAIDPRDPAGEAKKTLSADLVLVDEASMVDAALMAKLVRALPAEARLLLVGDADQLPSVGAGAVLADLLACPQVARVRLDRVFRQAQQSHIVLAAHQVLAGQPPQSAPAGGDFFTVARTDAAQIADTLCAIVAERLPRLGFNPLRDVQVLAPVHRGALGTQALNQRLRALLNPDGAIAAGEFRAGDKVLQLKNDYDLELSNGDIGTVISLSEPQPAAADAPPQPPKLLVAFSERTVAYPADKLDHLTLAYAVTVHKSQGSEYPAVVLPMHGSLFGMLQRNLLYTAITRARRFMVVVGDPAAMARAAANDAPMHRHTHLRLALGA